MPAKIFMYIVALGMLPAKSYLNLTTLLLLSLPSFASLLHHTHPFSSHCLSYASHPSLYVLLNHSHSLHSFSSTDLPHLLSFRSQHCWPTLCYQTMSWSNQLVRVRSTSPRPYYCLSFAAVIRPRHDPAVSATRSLGLTNAFLGLTLGVLVPSRRIVDHIGHQHSSPSWSVRTSFEVK